MPKIANGARSFPKISYGQTLLLGKAVSVFNGELHEIEAAMKLADQPHRIIAHPHETLTQHLSDGTRFAETKPRALEGEEAS